MNRVSTLQKKFGKELNLLYQETEIHILFSDLLSHIHNVPPYKVRENIIDDIELKNSEVEKLYSSLQELKSGKPIQYVLGEAQFFGNTFQVNESVLIPRPETEELLEWVLNDQENQSINCIDLGVGSGAIAVTLAWKLPSAQVDAMDVSKKAIEIAQSNAEKMGVKLNFILDDLLQFNSSHYKDQYDLIVSNPPYIRKSDFVEEQVYSFEPNEALYVEDENPLEFYQKIIKFAQSHLAPEGNIYVEINQFLGLETQELFETFFKQVVLKKDISNNYRFIKASELK